MTKRRVGRVAAATAGTVLVAVGTAELPRRRGIAVAMVGAALVQVAVLG